MTLGFADGDAVAALVPIEGCERQGIGPERQSAP